MTQTSVNPDSMDTNAQETLPQQEQFYRAPARFGNVPVEAEPKGWDRHQRFHKHYPHVNLPTQIVERVSLGKTEPHEPNRLIWGDNLHVMRQIPSNSIDLIYIDPPFFSGKQYNVIWGDNNELRSFNDIWEGGLDGYLIWLNARLYEMKRILKTTGSIYVHCDWHASHYIKVEMDKIFGYENFVNEIIWFYKTGGMSKRWLGRKHDIVFWYGKSKSYRFNPQKEKSYLAHKYGFSNVTIHEDKQGSYTLVGMRDVWDVAALRGNQPETIGYPTQKPEALLERIIKASSSEGDIVADFFIGGGTTTAVAQRLNRRFIACDQSRVAVAVTAERLKQQAMTRGMEEAPIPDFTVEQWGIYEAERLSQMPPEDFRAFVLRSYGATPNRDDDSASIHGKRNRLPVWVGAPGLDSQATDQDVLAFANAIGSTVEYQDASLRDGVMLAWGFAPDAKQAANQLRQREGIDVNFVRIAQVRIDDDDFRKHIVGSSTGKADYSEFLTFIQPPVVSVGYRANGGRAVTLDAGDSVVVNSGAEIINVQWDLNHDMRRFIATPGYSFQKGRSNNKKPQNRITHKFARAGMFTIACRVQDSMGGEGTWIGKVEVR